MEKIIEMARPDIRRILEQTLDGFEIQPMDALDLFRTDGANLEAVLAVANELRKKTVGDRVTFVIVRNINFTNICYSGCGFCGFAKRKEDPEAEFLSLEEVADRAGEAADHGATEVCIQGGLHPGMPVTHYRDILRAVRKRVPNIHIHAFSPFEIRYGAERAGVSIEYFLRMLRDNGLDSIPGTAAEILDTGIRKKLTKDKLSAEEWIRIIETAHGIGIPSTATIMYGHIDTPTHWVNHFEKIRGIQKKTGGFTEFVPLGFIHHNTPLFRAGGCRPGPTRDEHRKMHAIARIFFNHWIDHIQVSWVKCGPVFARDILAGCGADDMGGTLMNESISRSAGAEFGEELTPLEMCEHIREINRVPARRSTLYEILETYEDHEPPALHRLRRNAEQSTALKS